MRIIAGTLKGRTLEAPADATIRPTSDRAREAVFNLLMHGRYAGEAIVGQRVMDLCCGTGALGLEALSRGAAFCTFVDKSKHATALVKRNILHCNQTAQSQVLHADVSALPPAHEPVALVLMDAPYDAPLLTPAYASLRQGGWLAPETLIVSELEKNSSAPPLEGAQLEDERQYGKAKILVYRTH